jgi:hypothetical protein
MPIRSGVTVSAAKLEASCPLEYPACLCGSLPQIC